jgi:hypothetical protein
VNEEKYNKLSQFQNFSFEAATFKHAVSQGLALANR